MGAELTEHLKRLIEDALINERGVYVGSKLKHAKPLISLLEKTPIPNCETVAEKIWVILNGTRPVCVVCGNLVFVKINV